MTGSLAVVLWIVKAILPPLVFFAAAKPFFEPIIRIITNSIAWSLIMGIFVPITANGNLSDVPFLAATGFVQMCVGMTVLELIFSRREFGSAPPRRTRS